MLLAVDIGNTNIVLGLIKDRSLIQSWRITTNPIRTKDEYVILIETLLEQKKIDKTKITESIICSVVPKLNHPFRGAIESIIDITPKQVGVDIDSNLNIKLDNPNDIGADLIATAIGARDIFPHDDIIVIDCGTATKLTVVTKESQFLGGVIAPGLEISARALTEHTSLLPSIALKFPQVLIGTNTIDAIALGQMYGHVGVIKELIEQLKKANPKRNFKLVGTGGYMNILKDKLEMIDYVDADLIFRGLSILNEKNRKI